MKARRIVPLLHPGTMPARRGIFGILLIVGLFAGFAGLGLWVASTHHGVGPTAHTFEVSVKGASMSPQHLRVREGDQVILSVVADQGETMVVKGYDQRLTLISGIAVAATFVADRAGTFDIVIDATGKKLGVLEVTG